MGKVAKLFPFGGDSKEVEDADACAQAVEALRVAKEAEELGIQAIEKASANWP